MSKTADGSDMMRLISDFSRRKVKAGAAVLQDEREKGTGAVFGEASGETGRENQKHAYICEKS